MKWKLLKRGENILNETVKQMRSTERVFYIINLILSNNRAMKFSEILLESGLPKSSLHLLLKELLDIKILYYDENNQTYSIGMNFMELSFKTISQVDFLKVINTACSVLSTTINETVHAAILSNTNITYISKHEAFRKISIVNNSGVSLPAHATGVGKALLSGYTEGELKKAYKGKILEKYTPNTIDTLEELYKEISEVKKNGYSTEYGEISLLAGCISVPVRQNNKVIAAISITIPISKFTESYKEELLTLLFGAVRKVESALTVF